MTAANEGIKLHEEVKEHLRQARPLSAKRSYLRLLELVSPSCTSSSLSNEEREQLKASLADDQEAIDAMMECCQDVSKAVNSMEGLDWPVGHEVDGVKTTHQLQNDGTIKVCIFGDQAMPVFEHFAVLLGVDCWKSWVPLCTSSNHLHAMGMGEHIIDGALSTPFLSRDMVLQVSCVDTLLEEEDCDGAGCLFCFAKSVEDSPSGVKIPTATSSLFHDRIDLRQFWMKSHIISPDVLRLHVVMHLDMKIKLPDWMINFFVSNLLGIVFDRLKQRGLKIHKEESKSATRAVAGQPAINNAIMLVVKRYFEKQNWKLSLPKCLQSHQNDARATDEHVQVLSGILWKRGLGLLYTPWAKRRFVLDAENHVLSYYTLKSNKKKGEVFLSGMDIKLHPQDSSICCGRDGVAVEIQYGSQHDNGRSNMVLLAPSLQEAKKWSDALAAAAGDTSRPAAQSEGHCEEDGVGIAGDDGDEMRKTIAQALGIIPADQKMAEESKSQNQTRKSSTIDGMVSLETFVIVLLVLSPLLLPASCQAVAWISLSLAFAFIFRTR